MAAAAPLFAYQPVITIPSAADSMATTGMMRQWPGARSAIEQPPAAGSQAGLLFPTSDALAFIQPDFLGAPAASKANPGGAGNAEGNWWTPSKALDTDCEGNRVTARTVLTQECIYEKKVAEIKARQAISSENGRYKVEKLETTNQQQQQQSGGQ